MAPRVERATYEERRAERRYMAVDPDNRLVARGLEAEWEKSLQDSETAKAELTRREQQQPRMLVRMNAFACSRSAPICTPPGKRPPPRPVTKRNCCAQSF